MGAIIFEFSGKIVHYVALIWVPAEPPSIRK